MLFCGPRPLESVLFGAFGVVLDEQAEGGEAEQKGLHHPQEASGRVADAFVAAEKTTMNQPPLSLRPKS